MEQILISACLLGEPVRYDGRSCPIECERIEQWQAEGLLVPVCPEMDGGLPVPRPPAEITAGGGPGVWAKTARVITGQADVTAFFIKGAQAALDKAVSCGIKTALLKQKSPSCGSCRIYDGSFSRRLVDGMGVTTALLRQKGIMVFGEDQIDQLSNTL
ncbi:MAG: purine-nucleoside phosphorylase [Desulfobacter postgatei]|uniref:Purine-nucleoside phosphorylase n=1 Tax=Desulfobacter postgatei TaxID=2293 RepID=A0A2G6MRV2_9BACT|nr:MAG: purine-nucleoside phosphorylase [Desulfobacter postgatei]